MKPLYSLVVTALAASTSALAYTPAEERDFSEFAATGCRNRDGDFIIRGMVSSATEDTLVLSGSTGLPQHGIRHAARPRAVLACQRCVRHEQARSEQSAAQ